MSTRMQQNQIIEWRRAKVMELLSKGENNQSEIARTLQMDLYRALESRRYDVIDGTIENPVMKVQ